VERASPGQPVILHGDFSHDHIFGRDAAGPVTGVIDFGDTCMGDPAADWRGLWAWGRAIVERVAAAAELEDRSVLERAWITHHTLPADHIRFGLSSVRYPTASSSCGGQ
jgi:aminoglycoside 2''-phosphotransferase